MTAKWFVQSSGIGYSNTLPMVDALDELKIPREDMVVIPFSDEFTIPTWDGPRIYYGSNRLTTLAYQNDPKGVFFDPEQFKYSTFRANRSDMLNQNAWIITVEMLMDEMFMLQDDLLFFVRPDNDMKLFAGDCVYGSEVKEWIRKATFYSDVLDPKTKIVLAEPIEILAEWRWFVVNHKIIDGSMYKAHGRLRKQHETDPSVIAEAQAFANQWLPTEGAVTMDLALTKDHGMKVVEFNGFNATGFYDHDVKKIVRAVTDYVEKTHD